jgi:hypothetical protein
MGYGLSSHAIIQVLEYSSGYPQRRCGPCPGPPETATMPCDTEFQPPGPRG